VSEDLSDLRSVGQNHSACSIADPGGVILTDISPQRSSYEILHNLEEAPLTLKDAQVIAPVLMS
jgi:hypothetical protein